jgi:hypothetical protein
VWKKSASAGAGALQVLVRMSSPLDVIRHLSVRSALLRVCWLQMVTTYRRTSLRSLLEGGASLGTRKTPDAALVVAVGDDPCIAQFDVTPVSVTCAWM